MKGNSSTDTIIIGMQTDFLRHNLGFGNPTLLVNTHTLHTHYILHTQTCTHTRQCHVSSYCGQDSQIRWSTSGQIVCVCVCFQTQWAYWKCMTTYMVDTHTHTVRAKLSTRMNGDILVFCQSSQLRGVQDSEC